MPLRLDASDPGFAAAFAALVADRRESDSNVSADVAAIIADVRARGDEAIAELTSRFDGVDLDNEGWAIPPAELDAALAGLTPELRGALEHADVRIRRFHERQKPEGNDTTDAQGVRTGVRWTPVDAAGLYVPGGRAAYPSSVLMNAIPAVVAGVRRLVIVTPTPGGTANPLVLAAARLAGVSRGVPHRRRPGHRRARLRHRSASRASTSSPAPATPGWPRPSASFTASSASTWWPGLPKSSSSPTAAATRTGSPPICSPRPSMTRWPSRS